MQTIGQYKQYGDLAKLKIDKASRSKEIDEIGIKINSAREPIQQSIYELFTDLTESAKQIAETLELDVFSILSQDGTIISSAHWPAKFGYKDPSLVKIASTYENVPFLKKEETSEDQLVTIQTARFIKFDYGPNKLIVAGGYRLFNPDFLARLRSSTDAMVLFFDASKQVWYTLSQNRNTDLVTKDERLAKLAEQATRSQARWPLATEDKRDEVNLQEISSKNYNYVFTAIPLQSIDNTPLGGLLIGLSEDDFRAFLSEMKWFSYGTSILGIISAILLSILLALRVTRPIKTLSKAVGAMARGDLHQKIEIQSHDEMGMLGMAFNKMALDLRSQREKLLQAERVAAWREMARRVAHELKNPLFPIQVSVETMVKAEQIKNTDFPQIFSECTKSILVEINSLKNIVTEFSDFARMPQPRFAPTSVNDTLEQTAALFANQMNKVELRLSLDKGLPSIMADKDQLGRLIKNLISNALEAMPTGGRLEITTARTDQWLIVKVRDSGAGMSEETKNRLFTPYYTTKPKGTGLGLAIVQSIVADHHGKIAVESSVGQGTTVEIELPMEQPTSPGKILS